MRTRGGEGVRTPRREAPGGTGPAHGRASDVGPAGQDGDTQSSVLRAAQVATLLHQPEHPQLVARRDSCSRKASSKNLA